MKNRLYDDDADLSFFSKKRVEEMQKFKARTIEYEAEKTTLQLFDEIINDTPDSESWMEQDLWCWNYLTDKLRERIEKLEKDDGRRQRNL